MVKRSQLKKGPPDVDPVKLTKSKEILSGKFRGVCRTIVVQALVIAVAVWWIYRPALHGDWLWDDDQLVSANTIVHDPNGLWKIWFDPGSLVDYQPLKVSVSWLQWQLWGDDTLGYHLTNVVLHLVGALLVWRLLNKFHLRLAWLGGLIFAIHPAQVESVAWMAELKNTLSLPPFLLAMCAWIDYEERGKKRDYFLALGLFLVAMLCKVTMAMFPLVILFYAWWKRGRIGWRDVKTSAPFFVVSLVLGLVAASFLHHYTVGDDAVPMGGFFSRLACAGLSISFYFSTCFFPVGLIPLYPRWVVDPPTPAQFLPWPILAAVLCWLWTRREGWGRHALLGLFFFLVNLAPFVGFTTASYMKYTWVMDHVLYIPSIGLIGLVAAGLGQMEERLSISMRFCGIGLAAVVMILLAWLSHADAGVYVNSEALWRHELGRNPDAYLAHNNLGTALMGEGLSSEAMEQYEEALRIYPDYPLANNNLGNILVRSGRVGEAIGHYEQAVRVSPDNAAMRYNLGNALVQAGRNAEAIEQYKQALRIKPDFPEVCYYLANALKEAGRIPEATEEYEEALRLEPDDAEARFNLGNILFKSGRVPEAMNEYEQALRIKPDYADAHGNLGYALQQTGHLPEAMAQYEEALRIKPDYPEAHFNLGNALLQSGQSAKAMGEYEEALRIKPDYVEAHDNLGVVIYQTGRLSDAIEQFEEALRLNPKDVDARNNLARLQAQRKTVPAKN